MPGSATAPGSWRGSLACDGESVIDRDIDVTGACAMRTATVHTKHCLSSCCLNHTHHPSPAVPQLAHPRCRRAGAASTDQGDGPARPCGAERASLDRIHTDFRHCSGNAAAARRSEGQKALVTTLTSRATAPAEPAWNDRNARGIGRGRGPGTASGLAWAPRACCGEWVRHACRAGSPAGCSGSCGCARDDADVIKINICCLPKSDGSRGAAGSVFN